MASETKHTPGPWFVAGVRHKMNGGEWHGINRYDEDAKRDENIACVGYDPRTNLGFADAKLIAAAPEMLAALKSLCDDCASYHGNEIHISCEDHGDAIKRLRVAREVIAKATS